MHKESSESHVEEIGKEEGINEEAALGENGGNKDDIKTDEFPSPIPDNKPDADLGTDMKETSAVETVMETSVEPKEVSASEGANEQTPAGEDTKLCTSEGKASETPVIAELPKVNDDTNVHLLGPTPPPPV